MKRLLEGSINVTALYNHLLRALPATMYMHIEGHSDPAGFWRSSNTTIDGSYRAVYTVKFSEAVFVLHVFQKKSKPGQPGRSFRAYTYTASVRA